jgi:hypothetical protein
MKNSEPLQKQVSIDADLHAPFKSYCSGVKERSVKSVVSEIIREKLQKENFYVGENDSTQAKLAGENL